MKRLAAILELTLFFVAILFLAKIEIQRHLNLNALESHFLRNSNLKIEAEHLAVSWTGWLSLRNAKIFMDDHLVATSKEIQIQVGLTDLLHRKLTIKSVVLNHPSFNADVNLMHKILNKLRTNLTSNQKFVVKVERGQVVSSSIDGAIIPLEPPLLFHGSYDIQTKASDFRATLNGQNLAALIQATPLHLPVQGALYGELHAFGIYPKIDIDFSGNLQNVGFQNLIIPSAQLLVQGTFPHALNVKFHTDQFSLHPLEFIRQFIPIDGTGTLNVSLSEIPRVVRIDFSFPNVTLNGKPLGTLSGVMKYHSHILQLQALNLPFASSTGVIDVHGRHLAVNTILHGAKIEDLMQLLKQSNPSVAGNLDGNLTVQGPFNSFIARFDGKVKSLTYHRFSLGDGTMHLISKNQTLKGTLLLDHPVTLKSFPLENYLTDALGEKDAKTFISAVKPVKGFTISGTTSAPALSFIF